VGTNTKISVIFSEAMDPATINSTTFTLTRGATPVAGAVTYSGVTAVFAPTGNLIASTMHTATITTGAMDLADNALAADKIWSFTTAAGADTAPPTVFSTMPADAATDVALNANVTATFSEAMDPATITETTFTLKQGMTDVSGVVTYSGTVATLNPDNNFAASTTYDAAITVAAMDLAGNALTAEKTWSFETGDAAATGPDPVNLGTAGDFVILAKSGISTVPSSVVTGNIGVSPIGASAITGFALSLDSGETFSTDTSGQVTGKVYASDYETPTPAKLTTAVSDMQTAYTDIAGRSLPDFTELGTGDISGLTLVPGLYKWGTGVSISNVGVTLSGGPNDVWIFQIGQGITVASDAIVTLAGALPENIFWQSAETVAIGTNAEFAGIVLSQTDITLATGATVDGRLLAQTEVTLQSNTVTAP
jgi:hypothetical protein